MTADDDHSKVAKLVYAWDEGHRGKVSDLDQLIAEIKSLLSDDRVSRETLAHPFNRPKRWHFTADEAGLQPCPHCGPGQSVVELVLDDSNYWMVICGRCGSHSGTLPYNSHFPDAKERIVAGWNKRDGKWVVPVLRDLDLRRAELAAINLDTKADQAGEFEDRLIAALREGAEIIRELIVRNISRETSR